MNVQALEHDGPRRGRAVALCAQAHSLALEVLERLDFRSGKEIDLAYQQFGDIIDALLDISHPAVFSVEFESIRIGDRDIHSLEIQKVVDVLVSDRKSTRLNSSHRCISYAVFC